MKRSWLGALVALLISIGAHAFAAPEMPKHPNIAPVMSCEGLGTRDFGRIQDAATEVTSAKIVAAADGLPAYCDVQGYITPNIGFEMVLPAANWNGRFAAIGCGGLCGAIQVSGCNDSLVKGYSCIATDMGHKSTAHDAGWAYNNLQAVVDFGFRATHVSALTGKAISEAFYGKAPTRSIYMGCSTGGRQGYIEAERYPLDFDGILAGAPPLSETGDGLGILWNTSAVLGPDGKAIIGPDDLTLVNKAVIAQCDMDDGVKDGVVSDPRNCKFDPSSLVCKAGAKSGCLSAAQAEVFKRFYRGPHDSKGNQWYPGIMPGSEPGWLTNYVRADRDPSYIHIWMQDMMRYMDLMPAPGPSWSANQIDWDKDPPRLATMEAFYSALNPNLDAFKAAGGKFISWHGWNDHYVQPEETTQFYEMIERTMGGRAATQDFFRLFMVPGMNHCTGGSGAYAIDLMGALEAWVEDGKAPDKLIAVRPRDEAAASKAIYHGLTPPPAVMDNPLYSRPIFPYPVKAKYKGSGDTNDAANFAAE